MIYGNALNIREPEFAPHAHEKLKRPEAVSLSLRERD
jgi:hypothetical protein